jgi:SAM-dependent methyltransferase
MSATDPEQVWTESVRGYSNRSNYKDVWNRQAQQGDVARLAVAGHYDEAQLEATAEADIRNLRALVGVYPNDLVLEIGCGVARVGRPLSQQCRHWFGADISGEMLKHAAERLRGCDNVTLVELSTVGLPEFYDDTLDLVYCTIVFMHLLEWDRFRYVQEAFRVLRPGGRCYVDNFAPDTAHGWEVFSSGARYPLERRPAHISMSSTREELRFYFTKAGFIDVDVHDLPNGLIAAFGRKREKVM